MKYRIGKVCIVIGFVFFACAIFLLAYNMWDNHRAKERCDSVLLEYEENVKEVGLSLEGTTESLYEIVPEMEMPMVMVDGISYIGTLEVPSLGLNLPISSTCSENLLKISPCRYMGSVYTDDLIIAGHNYKSHFSGIKKIEHGAKVIFTDVDNNIFTYEVVDIETIHGENIDGMIVGDWDLTLFTCTTDGKSRASIRCEKIDLEMR